MKKSVFRKNLIAGTLVVLSVLCLSGCMKKEGSKTGEGIASIQAGDFDAALASFDEAEHAGENAVYIHRGRGIAYMSQNRYDEAAKSFEEALHADGSVPTDVDYDINFYLGVCYYKLGRYEESVDRFSAILALKEKNVDAYVERGTAYLALGKTDEATADFDRAVELAPKDYGLCIDIYCILREAGKETIGAAYLQNAVDSEDKKMPDYDKGRLYFYLGDYSNARDYLEKAKGSGNGSEELILLLGQCYENLNDRTYAISVYTGYLASAQSRAVYNQLGMCYAASGDYQSALAAFQTGLGLSDYAFEQELRFNEIVAYEKMGDFITAKDKCAEYVEAYPGDEEGEREYRFLKTR
ncbi:MAG: tetratricopeptide repeat protein [Lachnospiraceae bacterium]|nr:tetratricopeptide repeat protein [Lachnospiraceae bacterium]